MTRDPFLLPGDEAPSGDKLQKVLAAAGVASRRHAEVLIRQGRVTVNGDVARLGDRVDPEDRICVNGIEVGAQAPRLYLVNKPAKFITSMDDPQGRATVAELVPDDVRVYPVGRLDYDTSGLLIMTNDGELAHRLMHPSFGVEKTYRALVEGEVKQSTVRMLCEGVDIGEGDGVTSPAKVRILDSHGDKTILELIIHEGKNRQVRRMCDIAGHPVIELVRTGYGPLTLGALAKGTHRPLTDPEIRRLRKAAGLAPPRRQSDDERPSRAVRRAAMRSEQESVEADGKADAERGGKPEQHGGAARPGGGKARKTTQGGKPQSSNAGKRAPGARGGGGAGGNGGNRGNGGRGRG